MIWVMVGLWAWAGLCIFMASKRELDGMVPAGKLIALIVLVLLWPLFPILVLIDD